jgi:hypothetical protein
MFFFTEGVDHFFDHFDDALLGAGHHAGRVGVRRVPNIMRETTRRGARDEARPKKKVMRCVLFFCGESRNPARGEEAAAAEGKKN